MKTKDNSIQGLTEWLQTNHNYTLYDTRFEYPYTFKGELSKKVDSKSVCDHNNKLSVYVTTTQRIFNDKPHNNVDVSITAEKKDKWWKLKCYSLRIEEVYDDLERIEKDLIDMFNVL